MAFTQEQAVARGQAAGRLLRDETFVSTLKELEDEYVAAWRAANSSAERESAWFSLRAVDDLRQLLAKMVTNGDFEEGARKLRDTRKGRT